MTEEVPDDVVAYTDEAERLIKGAIGESDVLPYLALLLSMGFDEGNRGMMQEEVTEALKKCAEYFKAEWLKKKMKQMRGR